MKLGVVSCWRLVADGVQTRSGITNGDDGQVEDEASLSSRHQHIGFCRSTLEKQKNRHNFISLRGN